MFYTYGNSGNINHTSRIDADAAANVVNSCIELVNDMIKYANQFDVNCQGISSNWKGGGTTPKVSQLYTCLTAAQTMHASMLEAIAYSEELIATLVDASNQLYAGYDSDHVLFNFEA